MKSETILSCDDAFAQAAQELEKAAEHLAKAADKLGWERLQSQQAALQCRRRADNLLPAIENPDRRVTVLCGLADISLGLAHRSDAFEFIGRAEGVSGKSDHARSVIAGAEDRFQKSFT